LKKTLTPGLNSVPRHVAVIMDGNGRWAKARFLPRVAGHKKGVERVRDLIEVCAQQDISALTLFAFSQENWRRPADEVSFLMELLLKSLQQEAKALHQQNIQLKMIGDRQGLSAPLLHILQEVEALTSANTGLKLRLAINYGGQWDILQAVNRAVQHRTSSDRPLVQADIEQYLETQDLPPLDLLIRTSGICRISNFLLWQIDYTEIYFTEVLFPEFDKSAFQNALTWFQGIERRFGKTSEQLQKE
jgi:undecaprenyl diphosphate synthase